MPDDDPQRWRFADLSLGWEYPAAICWEGEERRLRRWEER
jgi:hypothetical protein